ncbi:MAG: PqqD family protein [Candidatus Uhrbacteria bacterium]|nr:PqqD family protein [Candidatus Uhrbacteria bacterium]
MSGIQTYRINDQKVINETLDGETIIINLENGNYYSMNTSGSVAWELLAKNHSLEQIVNAFLARYEANVDEIKQSLSDLTLFLLNEDLILETDLTSTLLENPVTIKETFLTPKIEKYEDMQEMLLADPIHDVDAVGWPTLK